jgi:hypothetical protein
MAYFDPLRIARDNCASLLAEATATPKPTYVVDGKEVQWTEYTAMLLRQIASINELLGEVGPDGPLEYRSVAV